MTDARRRLLMLGALGLTARGVLAAPYPDRAVRITIPFPAGAAADNAMRAIGRRMAESLRQPVVIDNRPGVPGIQSVATAPADGYTVLLGAGSSMVTAPMIQPRLPYQPARDFTPVARIIINVPVLVVHPSLGVRTIQDLIALARRQPGRLDYSTSGNGSPGHLAMEMFQSITGTQFVQIPYKGGATAVNDLIAGHVRLGINALPSVIQHIRRGELLALAVASDKRVDVLPDVPTMAQAGVPGFQYDIWYGLFAPAATPPETIERLSAAARQALADPEVRRVLKEQGAEPAASTPAEFAAFVKEDRARWTRLVKERRIRIEP